MDEDRLYQLITQYREQIADLEWQIKQLLISRSEMNGEGEVVSWADLNL